MLLLLTLACGPTPPCAGAAPLPSPDLSAWERLPIGEGVVCRLDERTLAVDYPGRQAETQLTAWAEALESTGWQVVELAEPERGSLDSRWTLEEQQLSLSVTTPKGQRITTVYVSRY